MFSCFNSYNATILIASPHSKITIELTKVFGSYFKIVESHRAHRPAVRRAAAASGGRRGAALEARDADSGRRPTLRTPRMSAVPHAHARARFASNYTLRHWHVLKLRFDLTTYLIRACFQSFQNYAVLVYF